MRIPISIITLLVIGTPAIAGEVPVPEVGTTLSYECTGPYYKARVYTLVSKEDDKARWELETDGKRGYNVQPLGLWGSMLNHERDIGDGKGKRTMEWNASDVAGYDPLTPGSSMEVDAKTVTRDWQANEEITVRVGERSPMAVAPLGTVDAVKISTDRDMRGLFNRWNYTSTMDVWMDAERGFAVKWDYKDGKGTQTCNLKDVKLGS